MKSGFLFVVLIAFLLLPVIVLADPLVPELQTALSFIFGPEVNEIVTDTSQIFQFLLFPFLTIIVVIYGILEQLGFFRGHSNIHLVLALLMAFMASVSGQLLIWVRYIYGGAGWLGTVLFGVLLFVGIILYVFGKMRSTWSSQWKTVMKKEEEVISAETDKAKIEDKIKKIREQINSLGPTPERLTKLSEAVKEKEMAEGRVQKKAKEVENV